MEIARHWRLQRHRYALVGEVCARCGEKIFPARNVCPRCNAPAKPPFFSLGTRYRVAWAMLQRFQYLAFRLSARPLAPSIHDGSRLLFVGLRLAQLRRDLHRGHALQGLLQAFQARRLGEMLIEPGLRRS